MTRITDYRRKGTSRLRAGRYTEANRIYHVITSTQDRSPVFRSLQNGRLLVRAMRQEQESNHAITLAFVIMPDHLHWLLQLTGKRSLELCINAVKSGSAREINRLSGRSGKLWQKGFYDRAIRYDDDLVAIARYIVANPVRAGIVDSIRKYSLWDAQWI